MKLARIGAPGAERPAALWDEIWYDLSEVVADLDGTALEATELARLGEVVRSGTLPAIETPERFGPPIARVGKVVCVGLNYREHAEETGAEVPVEPILFLKAGDTVVGAHDEVLMPRGSDRLDWEVELAVVIGTKAAYLEDAAAAAAVIAGYSISHDVSERTFQLDRGGQWDKGKNGATFNPLGPYLVPATDIGDPQDLGLRLWVNGELMQNGNTRTMVFGVLDLVAYISQFMTLYPGDVINTGTPSGVALGRAGDPFLRPGDVVEVEIDGLGRQRQVIGAA